MEKLSAKIISIKKLTSEISEFVFQLDGEIEFKPGQFVMLEIPVGEKITKRAYSLVGYSDGKLTLLIKFTGGVGTSYLWERKEGDNLMLTGCYGYFGLRNKKENLVFFATGIGLPPIGAILKGLENSEKKMQLFFGVRTKADLFYLDFLDSLKEKNSNFSYTLCLSREKFDGFQGYITEHPDLEKIHWETSEAYYCGSLTVLKSLKEKLFSLGLDKKDFIFEAFG